jgi:hypothetical protein
MSKVCVVTAQSFPSGMASNNRILSYSKGLVEIGNEVDVLSINKSNEAPGRLFSAAQNSFSAIFIKPTLIPLMTFIKGIYSTCKSTRALCYVR